MRGRRGLTPWIENLIRNYDTDEGIRAGGIQAHVVRVGHMSQSQALGSEGPTGLLFLSDEQVQIPAVLTTSAWEELQEEEDLECFSSLLDHNVCITDYRLLFHMSAEQTRCKFFLSVGKLRTTAVVGITNTTPCCTSLPSVQNKICQTWRVMLSQQDTQKSEGGFNLTELLGEWQKDCLLTEVEHVQKALTVIPQPSSSTVNPTASMPDTCSTTGWDRDMVHYKKSKSFAVPVEYLLIPDASRQLHAQTPSDSESVGPCNKSEHFLESTTTVCGVTTKKQSGSEDKVNDVEDAPFVLSGTGVSPMSNPWDMCPPPSNTSSTKSSPQASPVPHSPISTEPAIVLCPLDTSTQVPAHSKGSQRELPTEPSVFPPYQRPSASVPFSLRQSVNALSMMSEAADPTSSRTSQETANAQLVRKCRRVLRKRGAPPPEDVTETLEDEEGQLGSSPPSWMFDSLMGSTSEQSVSQTQSPPGGQPTEVHPCVHGDGKPFSYTYQVNGQELQHFSSFTVGQDLLQWAVRYLLRPKHREHNSTDTTAPEAADSHITNS